jgi:DNA-binding response OmpR family regulator
VQGEDRVLTIASEETREVLQTALERHGMTTVSAGRLQGGVSLASQVRPQLIVVDIESVDAKSEPLLALMAEPADAEGPRLLVLGTYRCQGKPLAQREFVSKPYQYGVLIRRIEELIGEGGACRHCSSSAGPIKEPALN